MSGRATVLVVAAVAILGVAGLLLAAGNDGRSTAFSLDIAPAGPVSVLQPGQAGSTRRTPRAQFQTGRSRAQLLT